AWPSPAGADVAPHAQSLGQPVVPLGHVTERGAGASSPGTYRLCGGARTLPPGTHGPRRRLQGVAHPPDARLARTPPGPQPQRRPLVTIARRPTCWRACPGTTAHRRSGPWAANRAIRFAGAPLAARIRGRTSAPTIYEFAAQGPLLRGICGFAARGPLLQWCQGVVVELDTGPAVAHEHADIGVVLVRRRGQHLAKMLGEQAQGVVLVQVVQAGKGEHLAAAFIGARLVDHGIGAEAVDEARRGVLVVLLDGGDDIGKHQAVRVGGNRCNQFFDGHYFSRGKAGGCCKLIGLQFFRTTRPSSTLPREYSLKMHS